MQNIYPLFEHNRILKKELLWSLRDYSFSHLRIEYQEYSQGILQGCEIQVQGSDLTVGPGMIKYGEFICLMMETQRIEYQPSEQTQYLKLNINIDQSSPDYIAYQIGLLLDTNETKNENEFELCRFNLRSGAKLRVHYKDFYDMETAYDTINVLHADWGGLGGRTISPVVTRCFAETILAGNNSLPEDRSFAYLILSKDSPLPIQVLTAYCGTRTGQALDNKKAPLTIYKMLSQILDLVKRGEEVRVKDKKERRRILVD